MMRAVWLFVGVAACASCANGDGDVRDFGRIDVRLWQPEDESFVDDATTTRVDVVVDGETASRTFQNGEAIEIDAVDVAVDGSDVEIAIASDGAALPDGFGRTPILTLEPEEPAPTTVLVLSAVGAARAFSSEPTFAASSIGACARDGHGYLVGGFDGATRADTLVHVDIAARTFDRHDGVAGAFSSCGVTDDGELWALVGCAVDRTGTVELRRSVDRGVTLTATDVADPALQVPCGAMVTAAGDAVWLVDGTTVERRDASGAVVASGALPSARHFARLHATPDGLYLSGGFTDASATTAAASASFVATDGTHATAAILDGALFARRDTTSFALRAGGIFTIAAGAVASEIVSVDDVALPGGFAPRAIAPLPDDRFALLSGDGTELHVVGSGRAASTVPVDPPREAMFAEPGGALFLVGGGAAGVAVFIAPPL